MILFWHRAWLAGAIEKFPSLQTPTSYNLDQVIEAMREAKHISHAGE